MSDQDMQPNQPTEGRRVRRAYLALVLGGPWVLILLGVGLSAAAFFSAQPVELRISALATGAILLIVGALMVRLAGQLEVNVPQGGAKANVGPLPVEALLLAEEAAVRALPPEDPDRRATAAKAALDTVRRVRTAEVLAEVRTLLNDANPDRIGINASKERSPALLADLRERHDRLRVPLLTTLGSDPSPEVRHLGVLLEMALDNAIAADESFVRELLDGTRDVLPVRQEALGHHTTAMRVHDRLQEMTQGT